MNPRKLLVPAALLTLLFAAAPTTASARFGSPSCALGATTTAIFVQMRGDGWDQNVIPQYATSTTGRNGEYTAFANLSGDWVDGFSIDIPNGSYTNVQFQARTSLGDFPVRIVNCR